MPKIVPNILTSYQFTDEELLQAVILPELTKMYLMTLRSSYVQQRLALAYDPESPLKFLQQEAELKGQILLLDYLINSHEEAVTATTAANQLTNTTTGE